MLPFVSVGYFAVKHRGARGIAIGDAEEGGREGVRIIGRYKWQHRLRVMICDARYYPAEVKVRDYGGSRGREYPSLKTPHSLSLHLYIHQNKKHYKQHCLSYILLV